MTDIHIKLVEVLGDKVVALATIGLACYALSLLDGYCRFRLEKTGKDLFPPQEQPPQ